MKPMHSYAISGCLPESSARWSARWSRSRAVVSFVVLLILVLSVLMTPRQVFAQSAPENLVLDLSMLAPLDESVDGHYEGWAIVGGGPISTGKFNVD